jgi:hypothetical protein
LLSCCATWPKRDRHLDVRLLHVATCDRNHTGAGDTHHVISSEAAGHPQEHCCKLTRSRDGSVPAGPDQGRAAGAGAVASYEGPITRCPPKRRRSA